MTEAQHLVAISPEQIAVPQSDADRILALAGGSLGRARQYLGPLHVGVLTVLHDIGRLPDAKTLRSSRDIAALQHTLGDLESLGLVEPAAAPGFVVLSRGAARSLVSALDDYWVERALAAAILFERSRGRPRKLPGKGPQAWTWLRRMLAFISNRGLRVTGTGALHRSDLRRFEAVCEMPSRQFLNNCLTSGLGLGLFFSLNESLIIGTDIDLLDLPPAELALEVISRWAGGQISLQMQEVSSIGGLLAAVADPIKDSSTLPSDSDNRLFRNTHDTHSLVTSLLGPMPIDPVSPFMAWTYLGSDYLEVVRPALISRHARLRAGIISTLGSLPRDTHLRLDAIAELLHCHIALDNLRNPTWVQSIDGHPHTPFATATRVFESFKGRVEEHLEGLVETLLLPSGLALVKDAHVWINSQMPRPESLPVITEVLKERFVYKPDGFSDAAGEEPLAELNAGQGRLIVQPNGEVMAPPDVSVHALVHLACGAAPVSLLEVSTFSLTRRSLMRLSDTGIDVRTWAEMLSQFSIGPLPSTIKQLVDDVARAHGEMTLTPGGGVLIARDPIRLNEVLSYPKLARQVLMKPSPTVAILSADCDLQQLLFELGDRGFSGVIVEKPPPQE